MTFRTSVGIIGAGPAGLFLSHLLHRAGIESVVLENRSRDYVERRVRAGVLEHAAAGLLRDSGVGSRMDQEGLPHRGVYLQFDGSRHHLDFVRLTGRGIVVYGQQEVVKDLIDARLAAGGEILFEAEAQGVEVDREGATVTFTHGGAEEHLDCDYCVACDGAHGVGRKALLARGARSYEREYPHAWLGLLARTPPIADELVYAYHERGFALHSMRSPDVSRLYLQVGRDATLDEWPLDRIWPELRARLGEPDLREGEVLELGISQMSSFVMEPMQDGHLLVAGDAAHIVPPTGAKGMNLAIADVTVLAGALADWYRTGSTKRLDSYTADCLQRLWRAEYFSTFMTQLLHRQSPGDMFEHHLHLAQLSHVTSSDAAATALAENYTGAATEGVTLEV